MFPRLPRHELRKVKPQIQNICKKHGIPYECTSMFEALTDVLAKLQTIAKTVN